MASSYTLTEAQLSAVTAALPHNLRGFGKGIIVTAADDSGYQLAVFDSADAAVAPIVADVLAGRTPPAPLSPVPAELSRRQFFQATAMTGFITPAEAEAAMVGQAIPAAISTLIETLPTDRQLSARFLVLGASSFLRENPLLNHFSAALGHTAADVDEIFRLGAAL